MERLPNSSSRAYGPKTELSRMRACVPLGCFSTWLEFVTLGVWVSTSSHHPFPPTCRYCHRSCQRALGNHLAEENTKRLQSSGNGSKLRKPLGVPANLNGTPLLA